MSGGAARGGAEMGEPETLVGVRAREAGALLAPERVERGRGKGRADPGEGNRRRPAIAPTARPREHPH